MLFSIQESALTNNSWISNVGLRSNAISQSGCYRPIRRWKPPLPQAMLGGLPGIQVSPTMGKLLQLLAQSIGARVILEIGTLGGYSTILLARAVAPGGRVVTLELNSAFSAVARSNLARAGLAARVEVRIGPALETLPLLAAEASGPFDLIFIDADKESTAEYFRWALKLSRRGSLIVVDNVVREGTLIDEDRRDAHIQGIRDFHALAAAEPRVSMTAIQTVGIKGYDGFAIALVVEEA